MPRTPPPTPSPARPSTAPSPPNLRCWLDTWLRLLSPTQSSDGITGRVLARLRLLLTGSVVLAVMIILWVSVALLVGGAWQLLSQGRLGTALMSVLSGAVASVGGGAYRRRKQRRRD